MLDFTKPLTTIGRTAGGLGGGLAAGLAGLSDVLSAPRRLAWKALSAPFGADIESGDDLMGAMGLDTENPLVKALGMGAEIVGDPLTYLGGLGGALAGGKAAAKLAPGLEAAAIARGPRYAGGIEKILESGIPHGDQAAEVLVDALKQSPNLSRVLQEVPEGSKYLKAGAEALTFTTPTGDVVRIQPEVDRLMRMARPDIPEMLPAHRAGLVNDVRVERSPFADTSPFGRRLDPALKNEMESSIAGRGFDPADIHRGNLGMYEGQAKVIDPGAVLPMHEGPQPPTLPDWSQQQPGRFTNWMLDRLNADQAVRSDLARIGGGSPITEAVSAGVQSPSSQSSLLRLLRARQGGLPSRSPLADALYQSRNLQVP